MNIGIITFHWATNYGAILQAYALQEYLLDMGFNVSIINYRPINYKKKLRDFIFTKLFLKHPSTIFEFFKERKLEDFRKEYLNETKLYNSLKELKINPPCFDIYITGSDQVWNEFFTLKGEGSITTSYLLDFGPHKIKRIAYAISFGCDKFKKEASDVVKPYLKNFLAISVREKSGRKILESMGSSNIRILPDPTLLLPAKKYIAIFENSFKIRQEEHKYIFLYLLHGNDFEMTKVKKFLSKKYNITTINKFFQPMTIAEWLGSIFYSKVVVTNSYHGMLFSIIFNKPFIIVLSNRNIQHMNDRFISLLNYFGLNNRIIYKHDVKLINQLIDDDINWKSINFKINSLQLNSKEYFENNLNFK
jgi:hypothetical protein